MTQFLRLLKYSGCKGVTTERFTMTQFLRLLKFLSPRIFSVTCFTMTQFLRLLKFFLGGGFGGFGFYNDSISPVTKIDGREEVK